MRSAACCAGGAQRFCRLEPRVHLCAKPLGTEGFRQHACVCMEMHVYMLVLYSIHLCGNYLWYIFGILPKHLGNVWETL